MYVCVYRPARVHAYTLMISVTVCVVICGSLHSWPTPQEHASHHRSMLASSLCAFVSPFSQWGDTQIISCPFYPTLHVKMIAAFTGYPCDRQLIVPVQHICQFASGLVFLTAGKFFYIVHVKVYSLYEVYNDVCLYQMQSHVVFINQTLSFRCSVGFLFPNRVTVRPYLPCSFYWKGFNV